METDWDSGLQAAASFHTAPPWVKLLRAPRRLALIRWAAWSGRRGGAPVRVRARLFWGDEMQVMLPDPVSAMLYGYGHYEPELTGFLLRFLKPGAVAIDVGAHCGYYSLLMSRLVGSAGTVHAFEPTPRTFALLTENLCSRPNVRLNQAAVWRENTTLDLSDFGSGLATFNTVTGGRLEDGSAAAQRPTTFRVPAIALDRYLESCGGRADFFKIDAENAEAEVLEGLSDTLAARHAVISLEVGDLGLGGEGRTKKILVDLLDKDYAIFDQDRTGLIPHRLRDHYTYGNVLLVPSRRADELFRVFPGRSA